MFWSSCFCILRLLNSYLRLISQLHLPGLIDLLNIPLMVFQKAHVMICLSPFIIKLLSLLFIYIIIMIGFFNVTTNFLSDNLSAFVIKHSLLGYSVDALIIFIGLLLLRYCVPSSMFSRVILEIVLLNYFAIRSYFGRTYETLHHIRSLGSSFMQSFMN